jgi:amino acid adenylation domain-containing protein
MKPFNLADDFFWHAAATPDNSALYVGGRLYSYGELAAQASGIAGWIRAHVGEEAPRIGIWANRSLVSYAGILGILWAGATYVPLSSKFPKARLAEIVKQAELSAVIVDDPQSLIFDDDFSTLLPSALLIDNGAGLGEISESSTSLERPVPVGPDSHAYLMFTSGTTGKPKGIPVTVGNVSHFIEVMQARYQLGPEDRVSQFSELTFDVSVFDMFMAWCFGATLYPVPANQIFTPVNFIREHELTVWLSVPSLIGILAKIKLLKPGCLASLRLSLFAGEPFPLFDARLWQQAAPNSVVENLYGTTEDIVVCSLQPFTSENDITPERGILAIGKPYPGTFFAIVDEAENFLDDNQEGELIIAGPQVTPGYWRKPELTAQRYPVLSHPVYGKRRWYLTGDKAYRDSAGVYHFLGRVDNQAKIGGHRIELEEIEFHIREVIGAGDVVVMVMLDGGGDNLNLVAVSNRKHLDPQSIKRALRERLPGYMVPHRIVFVDDLPRNQNGKIDRKATAQLLKKNRL